MNRSRRRSPYRKWVWVASLLVIVVGAVFLPALLVSFLSENEPIEADVLIVEGWLSEASLEEAVNEFRSHPYRLVLTTGVAVPPVLFVHSNSRVVMSPSWLVDLNPSTSSTIRVEARGTPANGVYPHIAVLVNDSVSGDRYVTKETASYTFPIRQINGIQTVAVAFDNDAKGDGGEDRNLYITGVWLDQYRLDTLEGRVVYHYNRGGREVMETPSWTLAERSARTLRRLGLDSALVVPVPVADAPLGRTYTSAMNCQKWLSSNNSPVRAINVFSQGIHTRRSHYLYQKAFGEQARIGIISASAERQSASNGWTKEELRLVAREFGKYLYARFLQVDKDD